MTTRRRRPTRETVPTPPISTEEAAANLRSADALCVCGHLRRDHVYPCHLCQCGKFRPV